MKIYKYIIAMCIISSCGKDASQSLNTRMYQEETSWFTQHSDNFDIGENALVTSVPGFEFNTSYDKLSPLQQIATAKSTFLLSHTLYDPIKTRYSEPIDLDKTSISHINCEEGNYSKTIPTYMNVLSDHNGGKKIVLCIEMIYNEEKKFYITDPTIIPNIRIQDKIAFFSDPNLQINCLEEEMKVSITSPDFPNFSQTHICDSIGNVTISIQLDEDIEDQQEVQLAVESQSRSGFTAPKEEFKVTLGKKFFTDKIIYVQEDNIATKLPIDIEILFENSIDKNTFSKDDIVFGGFAQIDSFELNSTGDNKQFNLKILKISFPGTITIKLKKQSVTNLLGHSNEGTSLEEPITYSPTDNGNYDNLFAITGPEMATTLRPTITWEAVQGAQYFLQIYDFTCQRLEYEVKNIPENSFEITEDLQHNSQYCISVAAFKDDGYIYAKNDRKFNFVVKVVDDEPPEDFKILTPTQFHPESKPQITWEAAIDNRDIPAYSVELYDRECEEKIESHYEVEALSITTEIELVDKQTYCLKITAKDKSNNIRIAEKIFTVDLHPDPPTVSVTKDSITDKTPHWIFESKPKGIGIFRYSFDLQNLEQAPSTEVKNFTPTQELESGQHILYVQERNYGEIWSEPTKSSVLISTQDGTLTQKSIFTPSGNLLNGMAISPDGKHLYSFNNSYIYLYHRDSISGDLTYQSESISSLNTSSAIFTPDGLSLLTISNSAKDIKNYSRDPENGSLTLVQSIILELSPKTIQFSEKSSNIVVSDNLGKLANFTFSYETHLISLRENLTITGLSSTCFNNDGDHLLTNAQEKFTIRTLILPAKNKYYSDIIWQNFHRCTSSDAGYVYAQSDPFVSGNFYIFNFNKSTGIITEHSTLNLENATSLRDQVFSPLQRHLYMATESGILSYNVNNSDGTLSLIENKSYESCINKLHISHDGLFLYAEDHCKNEIVIYKR